jgi:ribosomal protein L7/L12
VDEMPLFILIVISVLGVVLLFAVWFWRRSSVQDLVVFRKPPFKSVSGSEPRILSSDVVAQAHDLLSRSRKIEAIKLVRHYTDWNLQEAKDYVESLGAKHQGQSVLSGEIPADVGMSISSSVMDEVRTLLLERRKIEAIRLVRSHTGWGLKESKEFIDKI